MRQTFLSSLFVAALVCGAAGLAHADDQAPADQAPAAQAPAPMTHHGHKGGMAACKDDVAQFCADAKGGKAIHQCLEQNADKLSQGCQEARAKMAKRWAKHHKKAPEAAPAPAPAPDSQAPAEPPASTPQQ